MICVSHSEEWQELTPEKWIRQITWGSDNIEELQLIPVVYKQDTLAALVKLFQNGSYEYAKTKSAGTPIRKLTITSLILHSFQKLKNLEEGQAQLYLKSSSWQRATLPKHENNELSKQLEDQVVINPNLSKEMVLTRKSITIPASDDFE
ncbi:MAG: hypothetical protein U5L96_03415 [Owenweeksia sp.]|nr:hypothetical protein [Owenweeksia sp.]